jgi:hypothetical protein
MMTDPFADRVLSTGNALKALGRGFIRKLSSS